MQHTEGYVNIARRIFNATRYEASDEDVRKLAVNMALLEQRGLGKLNKRLVDARKHTKIFETIAEHNFAVMLISHHCAQIPINYEPDDLQSPPDFKVQIGDITFWIQIKDLQKLERENRQDKLIQKIIEKAKEIKVGKFFSCKLSDDFKEDCLPELIDFMKKKTTSAIDDKSFLFTSKSNQRAKIGLRSAVNAELSELTLGYAGDLEMVNLTGLARDQIKESLLNAAGAFKWEVDRQNINLIVMEADNKEDIDICDAVFGTEYESVVESRDFWCRENDGLFRDSDFSRKVAGVIAIKRKEKWHPVSNYHMILYMNDSFKHLLEDIKKLLSFDMVVYYCMRPPMGQGNFKVLS
ncbi:MAG: hypothetical protein HY739_15165 [Desulfobacterales bacterium]|nr:hypothetical protein [Desulfobacterales bacterium]